MDFAPKHAGAIFAVTNTVANLSGFLVPMLTGYLLDVENSLSQWQLSFWISAMVYFPGWVIFQIWGTDKMQTWAEK
jgi:MFS family permease